MINDSMELMINDQSASDEKIAAVHVFGFNSYGLQECQMFGLLTISNSHS